jgi:ABC-type glycerol-3-phosphate transport system substrate-binding protein
VDPVSPRLGATKAELNGEQQMAAVTWMHALIHVHKICPIPGDLDYKQVFLSGAGGFRSGGLVDWGDRVAIGDRFTLAYTSMPKGPAGKRPGFYNHDQMAMYAKTKHLDAAWALLTYFCGKEQGIRLGKAEGGGASSPGMRKDVWESQELAEEVPCLPMFRAHLDELETHWYAANLNTFKAWGVMDQVYRAMMINPTPPSKADFDEANKAVQAVLDEPRL